MLGFPPVVERWSSSLQGQHQLTFFLLRSSHSRSLSNRILTMLSYLGKRVSYIQSGDVVVLSIHRRRKLLRNGAETLLLYAGIGILCASDFYKICLWSGKRISFCLFMKTSTVQTLLVNIFLRHCYLLSLRLGQSETQVFGNV